MNNCDFLGVIFKISSLVIGYKYVVIDYTVNFGELLLFRFEFQNFVAGNDIVGLVGNLAV